MGTANRKRVIQCHGEKHVDKADLKLKRQPPKIVCIGAAIVDFEVLPSHQEKCQSSTSSNPLHGAYLSARIVQRPGGVGRNHADALARLGCHVHWLSAVGTDLKGRLDPGAMFLTHRGSHLDWSNCLHCRGQPTAISIGVTNQLTLGSEETAKSSFGISHGFISVDHLMERMTPEYIDSKGDLIASADYMLLDANLSVPTIQRAVNLANQTNTKIWFEPTNAMKVPKLFAALGPKPLSRLDILSPNLAEFRQLLANLDDAECTKVFKEFEEHLKAISSSTSSSLSQQHNNHQHNNHQYAPFQSFLEWLSSIKFPWAICPRSHLLITCDRLGILLISREDAEHTDNADGHHLVCRFLPSPHIWQHQIVSVSGAGDCFNSGFLYGLLHGHDIEASLEMGRECAEASLRSADAVPETISEEWLLQKWRLN